MTITRRQFLRNAGLATAGSFLGPDLLPSPFARKALADAIGDRYLVVLFLDGGNDGLNTVTPINDGSGSLRTDYESVRGVGDGGIQLSTSELLAVGNDPNTNALIGLHPALAGLETLANANRLAVIQGCGYPAQNLSHATSRGFWETGDRFNAFGSGDGWMGRYLVQQGFQQDENPAVNIRSSISGEYIQSATGVLAFTRLSKFGFPYDTSGAGGGSTDAGFKETAFQAIYEAATTSGQQRKASIGNTGLSTLAASNVYPELEDHYAGIGGYPSTGTGRELADIAKVIYGVETGYDPAVVCARYFELRNGGYDTHSNQGGGDGGRQFNLHQEVGDALRHFYDDLDAMGIAHKVLTVTWSEFSRRINQNSSGTDHGSQGPMFVIGDAINSGVYGNHPDLSDLDNRGNTKYSQDNTNPYRSTDFRDVFGTIVRHWLNSDADAIFPADDEGDPDLYWENPNFDMGFL